MLDDGRPIFQQIADQLESAILDGSLPEDGQVPSTTELAAFHRINPATAGKGVAQLVADGLIHKRRGIGMFVSAGARAQLQERRRQEFAREYVQPLLIRARQLEMDVEHVKSLLDACARSLPSGTTNPLNINEFRPLQTTRRSLS